MPPSPQAPEGDRVAGARYTAPRLEGRAPVVGKGVDLAGLPKVNLKTLFPEGNHDYAADETGVLPSGEKEEAWRKRMAEHLRPLSKAEVAAIQNFTGGHFTAVRLHETGVTDEQAKTFSLIKGTWERAAENSRLLTEGLRKAKPDPGTCFRGMNDVPEAQLQELLGRAPGFGLGHAGKGATSSATWSRRIAHNFADMAPPSEGHYNVVFSIRGKSQVGVAHVSNVSYEQEVIFSREARFRVVSVAAHDGDDNPHIPGYTEARPKERRKRVLVVELEEV